MSNRLTTILILVILVLGGCSYSPKQSDEPTTQNKQTILDEPSVWEEDYSGLTHEHH